MRMRRNQNNRPFRRGPGGGGGNGGGGNHHQQQNNNKPKRLEGLPADEPDLPLPVVAPVVPVAPPAPPQPEPAPVVQIAPEPAPVALAPEPAAVTEAPAAIAPAKPGRPKKVTTRPLSKAAQAKAAAAIVKVQQRETGERLEQLCEAAMRS